MALIFRARYQLTVNRRPQNITAIGGELSLAWAEHCIREYPSEPVTF